MSASAAMRKGEPRLGLRLPVGRDSASLVRPALAESIADADPVVIEQIAVLVGALTSGGGPVEASAPVEVEVWTDATGIAVMLRDSDFSRHRSEADFVQLDRSMVSGWRLRLWMTTNPARRTAPAASIPIVTGLVQAWVWALASP